MNPPATPVPNAARELAVLVNGDALQSGNLTAAIRKAGLEVLPFTDAAESLRHLAQPPPPRLVILDLHLPEIDGWRLCRLLRSPAFAAANACPILLTSAIYTGRDVEEISRDLGASGFLSLPCPADDVVQAIRAATRGEHPGPRSRVLVVDDEISMRQFVARGLTKSGFEVLEAATAAEARTVFDAGRPTVVLLDHHLQESCGIDLIPHFKRPGSPVVVLSMTGDLGSDLAVDYARRGIDGFAYKPFSIKQLTSAINHAQRERALLRVEELLAERTRVLRENDARMMQTARLASLGEMAAGIAHEINNPLFGVTSAAELLGEALPADSGNHELAALIVKEGERIALLVKRLLAFCREDRSEMAPHRLHDLVANTLTLIGTRLSKQGIRFQVDIPEDLPCLVCHSSQIQQALMALLMQGAAGLNARYPKYDPNKKLELRAAMLDGGPAPALVLEIEDHGNGIAPERLARLFQSPFVASESGWGLGLSLADDIVERHGGRIEVLSEPGAYTRFRVILPADPAAAALQEAAS